MQKKIVSDLDLELVLLCLAYVSSFLWTASKLTLCRDLLATQFPDFWIIALNIYSCDPLSPDIEINTPHPLPSEDIC